MDALSLIAASGFVTLYGSEHVVMHRLVAEFVLTQSADSEARLTIETGMRNLVREFEEEQGSLHTLPISTSHIRHVIERGLSAESPVAAGLTASWGRYLVLNKLWRKGVTLLQRAIDVLRDHENEFADDLADALFSAGKMTIYCTGAKDAVPFYQEAAAIRLRHYGSNHFRSAQALHSLGALHTEAGEYEQGSAQFQRSLNIFHALPSSMEVGLGIAKAHRNWGMLEVWHGNFTQGIVHLQSALEAYREWLEPTTSGLLTRLAASVSPLTERAITRRLPRISSRNTM